MRKGRRVKRDEKRGEEKKRKVLSGKSVKRGHLGNAVENSAFILCYNTEVYK